MRYIFPCFFFVLCFCGGCDFPRDSKETFINAATQGLAVGVVARTDSVAPIRKRERELVEAFMEEHSFKAEYRVGTETQLVSLMEKGQVDVIIGGFTEKTLWKEKAALTAPYDETHVWLVKKGESRLVFEIEKFFYNNTK